MAEEKEEKYTCSIMTHNVPVPVRDQLFNIAEHIGVTKSNFLKMEFQEILKKYPDHMKQPRPKD